MLKRKKIDSVTIPLTSRTVERQRGCWNCIAWDCGEKALKHYAVTRANDAKVLAIRGARPHGIQLRLEMQDAAMKPPRTGICLASGSRADFTFGTFLCDKWTGREKISAPLDPLADELWDRLGEKLTDKPGGGKL